MVRHGQLPALLLDNAVRRVLQAKQRLGLFQDPYKYSDQGRENALLLTSQSRALARQAAQQSIVLLKNREALLPLSKRLKTLLVVGSLAADARSSLGGWAADGRQSEAITILEGIKGAVHANSKVIYLPAASPLGVDAPSMSKVSQAAASADAIIAVLGETADMSGEAHSRASLDLPGGQQQLWARLMQSGKPVVLVLMNGRPLTLGKIATQAPAILET